MIGKLLVTTGLAVSVGSLTYALIGGVFSVGAVALHTGLVVFWLGIIFVPEMKL